MKVVYSERHLLHDIHSEIQWGSTVGNYEHAARGEVIRAALAGDTRFEMTAPADHGEAPVRAVHDAGLVDFLTSAWKEFQTVRAQREVFPDTFLHSALRQSMGPARPPVGIVDGLGYWCFETMTPLVEGTYEAARSAVDVALTAADHVLAGDRACYALCRPPGHHAPTSAYGGYCYFNNAAIAAQALVAAGAGRVTILDVDYHHGNGTQQIFYERDDVQYVSVHGDPSEAFPYFTGFADETGSGPGRGSTTNLPIGPGDDNHYDVALRHAVDDLAAFKPSILVVSLGVDTYRLDPVGNLGVSTEAFAAHGRFIASLGLPTVIIQEGGYHLPALGENVSTWLTGFATAG